MANSEEESRCSPEAGAANRYSTYWCRTHKFATLFMMTAGGTNAAMFPMMFIFYGGAPFLLAYLTLLATVAMPMMQLESNLAQFAGDGNCGIFSTVPLFLGTGYALTLYVVLRVVADSVPLSDVLVQMAGMTDTFPWGGGQCPGGWSANNRTCYAIKHGSTMCRTVRSRLSGSFQRQALDEGLPLLRGDLVVLVPSKTYQNEAARCTPDLYTPAPAYDFRRQQNWVEQSFENIRAQPLLCIACLWLLVFVVAHRGFVGVKNFFYVVLSMHTATTLMLLFRAVMLDGSTRGLSVFFHADWSHIANVEMWCRALTTCLESVGITGTIYLGVERFNSFKNRFQEDVMFVLVVDTASKVLFTIMAFLFLGNLSFSVGMDIATLIDTRSNLIVSITPQAISLAPDPEFWSQVHLLWLISMMLPKFLIVPDIIIEVLSASHPPILLHRSAVHSFICTFMFIISIGACSPGGASFVSVLAYTQNNRFRLLMVALETVVILQFYGFRRLALSSRLMTNAAPSTFVKVCWTSVIPVFIAVLMWSKAVFIAWERYPIGLSFAIAWFEMVEISFIPVFAVVFLVCAKMKLKNSIDPLPTWIPLSWEHAMLYRHQVLVEDIDHLKSKAELEKSTIPPSPMEATPDADRRHSHKRHDSPNSKSTSEHFATHQYVASDPAKCIGSPGDWREGSSEQSRRTKKSKKKRALQKAVPESGTIHVSQRLSSLRRLASRAREAVFKPKKPVAMVISSPGLIPLVPFMPEPAVGTPKGEQYAMPALARSEKDESGDTIDHLDFVVDSAAEHFLLAPVPSVGSVLPIQPAPQDAASQKSGSSQRDTAQKGPTRAGIAEGPGPSAQIRRPEPNLPNAPQDDAKLGVPYRGASNVPASAISQMNDDQLAAPEKPVTQASEDAKAQNVSGLAQEPPDKPVAPTSTEDNAPLKQLRHGTPVITSFGGRPSASKKSSTRKHSSSLKSSSSSQKAQNFDVHDGQPLPKALPSDTPLAIPALAPSEGAAAASGKSTSDKVRRQSKLKQPVHKLAQASDPSCPEKPLRGKGGEDRKSPARTASGARRQSSQDVLAGDIALAWKPSDANTSRGRLRAPLEAESGPGAAPGSKAAVRAPSSDSVMLPDKCQTATRGHPEQKKTTVPEKAAEQRGISVAGMSTTQQDAPIPSQHQTGQTDDSTTRKSSSGKTTNLLRKLVANRPRWNRRQRWRKRTDASADADADVDTSAAATATGMTDMLKVSTATQPMASVGALERAHAPISIPQPVCRAIPLASVSQRFEQAASEAAPRSMASLAQGMDAAAKDGAAPDTAASHAAQSAREQRDSSKKAGGHRQRRKRSKRQPDTSSSESADNRER